MEFDTNYYLRRFAEGQRLGEMILDSVRRKPTDVPPSITPAEAEEEHLEAARERELEAGC